MAQSKKSKAGKSLLEEAQVRRMMGLAGIPAVNESDFLDKYRNSYLEQEEEDPMEDPLAAEEDPLAAEEEPEAVEGEPAAMEPEAPADEANVETLVQALASTITDVTGVAVDAGDEAPAEEFPAEEPMDAVAEEPPMDAAAEEPAPEEELPMEEANLAKALAAAGIHLELDNDELVAEITKRVAARLVRESKRQRVRESKRKPTSTRKRK
jgi:hypothetical protein